MCYMIEALKLNQAAEGLSHRLRRHLINLPESVKGSVKEIRLRIGRPLSVYDGYRELFIKPDGQYSTQYTANGIKVTAEDIRESFKILCSYSVHTYQNEIRNGYITINGGHRAGICGTAVLENGRIVNIRDISSINLRIAREHKGCSDKLIRQLYRDGVAGTLLIGCPLSGKTTLLKDLIHALSSGRAGEYKKVSVIDERGELSAVLNGAPQNDVGICCDVFDGYPKHIGMQMAIRTMSPQIIVIDEIGDAEDARSIESCLNAGVTVIASVHASTIEELKGRRHILDAIKTGAFKYLVFLCGPDAPTKFREILTVEEFYDTLYRHDSFCNGDQFLRHPRITEFIREGK